MQQRPVHILNTLTRAGFEAYFVGGCVRDTLLGRRVHDWDITTSANPEEIMALFPKTVPTGIKHGTVLVIDGEKSYEVTTFRTDGAYCDSRHPDAVTFVKNLAEDLSRRDFTVNAMAMDKEGNITDLFGGQEDLKNKLLRTVGDAKLRFQEDALRIFRLFRFSAQLGFAIDPDARMAAEALASLCQNLSVERIREELEKTLLSHAPQTVGDMARLGLLSHLDIPQKAELDFLATLPDFARWAGLFSACPQLTWQSLRMDKKTGVTAQTAAQLVKESRSAAEWKLLISQHGAEAALCTAALSHEQEWVAQILDSGDCIFLKDLAVGGADFPALSGKALGDTLNRLLHHVHMHPEDNRKERLYDIYRQEIC